jgi:cytochrome c oxidase cbb3-type subunit I/II
MARDQAMKINADIVSQGGPANVYEKQAVALIAYLQRMGTDLNRTPEPPADSAQPPAPTAEVATNQ